ncbi:hypothetical protein Q7P37_007120 [Cladosporium fusiforme]
MASAGVLPWLVGLPATDTAWDDAPTQNATDATDLSGSPKSEPPTMRSRASNSADGTVARRAQSSSPAKQQSLAWKKRLVNGQLGYGDQTDLFGPSGLENIFTRTQATDDGSQKKHRHMGLKHRLSMDQNAENTKPPTGHSKHNPSLAVLSSPPFTQENHCKRTNDDSAENSPVSQSSQSSVADMLSEMVGKMNQLSESNKGYQDRMQAIKKRFDDSEAMRQESEMAGDKKEHANDSALHQRDQYNNGSAEGFTSQRHVLEYFKQTVSVERRTEWVESEHEQSEDDQSVLNHTREEHDWKDDHEGAQSELESLRRPSPQEAESEAGSESFGSEIITRPAKSKPHEADNDWEGQPDHQESYSAEEEHAHAGAERNEDPKRYTTFLTAQSATDVQDATGNRSVTDSELEDLTPVLIAKRTTSNGKVQFNAVHTYEYARSDVIKQRKDIDKTETSHRARELDLAMGMDESEVNVQEQSGLDESQISEQDMEATELSVADAEDESGVGETRHVSGFTDAPEVEEDMPIRTKHAAVPASWDFSEPPQNESSELATAHRRGESTGKRSISFGFNQLNDYAFQMADDEALGNATEATLDEMDGGRESFLNDPAESNMYSRDSSPPLGVQVPGSRMPFEFRKDSLSGIHESSHKSTRRSSAFGSVKTRTSPFPTMDSPAHASMEPDASHVGFQEMRSPPRVYVEDVDDSLEASNAAEGKRRPPKSPFKSPTPKRRRTLHDSELRSELQSMTEANVSYHSQLQEVIGSRERKDARKRETQDVAPPEVLAQRKIARPRNHTPTQGPATKDYINEAKKVIELLRGNVPTSSPLRGITEADEDEESEQDYEEGETDDYGPLHNTHKSDNMRTLAPQQVAHLIGGEMHGMTYDRTKNCWIRSKSFEHKQFLDPRDALSSDDDPFREISDLTVEKSPRPRRPMRHPSHDAGATTVVHHDLDDTGLSYAEPGSKHPSDRKDTPRESNQGPEESPKLPGEDTTVAQYDDGHETVSATEMSTPANLPSKMTLPSPPNRNTPIEAAKLQLVTRTPNANANINNTFLLSDLPDFTVHEEDRERPSERALATRMASYAAVEISNPYQLATTELVKAITDVQGQQIHWEDLTSLTLHDKSLKSLHGLELHCARIEKLDVSDNALTQLDGVPPFVRQLNAKSNQLVSLTSWAHLMHLQYLDITSNSLESLDGLGHLIHLRELRADSNKIRRLDGIADLDGLIALSARKNALREVNFEHFRFERIVDLDLSENDITSIEGIEALESLRTLKLDNNPLSKPLNVSKPMPRLRHLSLRSCGLRDLDVSLFPNLRTLEVDNNSLVTVTGLSKLKKLDVFSMCDQDLDDDECITVFDSPLEAQTVRLSRNTFTHLQLEHAFMSIKHLELADVGLVSLPDNFGIQMPNLRSLDLSYNGVRDIRPLAPLSGLESLTLVGCRIERLRKTVATLGKLRKLLKLDLKQNPLTQGFYGPDGSDDRTYKAKLDEETAMRRRTYELLVAYSYTREGFMLDGLAFDAEAAVAKDEVWERLVELGVLRKV